MKIIAQIFFLFCPMLGFCADKYELLKSAIEKNESAWRHEYQLRHDEAIRSGLGEDPTNYHYLWYAKGCYQTSEGLMTLINEIEKNN